MDCSLITQNRLLVIFPALLQDSPEKEKKKFEMISEFAELTAVSKLFMVFQAIDAAKRRTTERVEEENGKFFFYLFRVTNLAFKNSFFNTPVISNLCRSQKSWNTSTKRCRVAIKTRSSVLFFFCLSPMDNNLSFSLVSLDDERLIILRTMSLSETIKILLVNPMTYRGKVERRNERTWARCR